MKTLRVLCVGANLESQTTLQGLVAHGVQVAALVTRPSDNPGRGCDFVDMHDYCASHNIPVIDTIDINSHKTLDDIRAVQPDYIFVLGWSQIFCQELLGLPLKFVVGSHPSLLPKGRGRAPVPWTILQNLRKSGVTLFHMDKGADAGDILWQREFPVEPGIYAMQLYMRIADHLRTGFCELHDDLVRGSIKPKKQDKTLVSYRERRCMEDGHIDFRGKSVAIGRLVRAVSQPYPGAYAYHGGRKIEIWRADLSEIPDIVGTPGQILRRKGGFLLVQAGDKSLWISEFTCNGMDLPITDLPVGSHFGYRVDDEINKLWKAVLALQNGE
jgi:methionyl-tRNA formyltransferase